MRECLCKTTPAPPTLVIIKEIIESPMDLGVPASKKGQILSTIEGFTSLVLTLTAIIESSLGFIQKGTPIVLTIRGFDPLVLPRSIQGISRALGLKALEASLPGLVIISLKLFSLTPNLQTQEGVVIHMLKPFLYKGSHCVPWK